MTEEAIRKKMDKVLSHLSAVSRTEEDQKLRGTIIMGLRIECFSALC